MRGGSLPAVAAVTPDIVCVCLRVPVVPAGEAASHRQPAAGQRKADGLPPETEGLQDGHPVGVLAEYVSMTIQVYE